MTWTILVVAQEVAALAAIVVILRRYREPRAMLAWILTLLLLPVIGLLLFVVFSEPRKSWHRRRRRRRRRSIKDPLQRKAEAIRARHAHPGSERFAAGPRRLIHLAERVGGFPAATGNDVVIYHDAEKTFLAMQLVIEAAQSHVHLEYYILQPDETGTAIRDLLIKKAREGVECRVLLDYIGCWRLSRAFVRTMRDAGVQVAFAMPVLPWRGRWRMNFRNHRKIAVVDGRVGLTGSQNIGDEYRGRLARFGPWRDTHMKIVGPAVHHLQEVFVQDWHYTTREEIVTDETFPVPEDAGDHVVQIIPSGPDQRIHVLHQLLFAAVNAAESSVCVITPYFVPDSSMVLAFQSAAHRGVKVRLIVPTCTDHTFILWAGRSFYEELIGAGVEIYEEDHTMLHSKVMVIDQHWAMVGSANMDERSFRVNFELTTLLYSRMLAEELYADFEQVRSTCRRIRYKEVTHPSFLKSVGMGITRLASPLL